MNSGALFVGGSHLRGPARAAQAVRHLVPAGVAGAPGAAAPPPRRGAAGLAGAGALGGAAAAFVAASSPAAGKRSRRCITSVAAAATGEKSSIQTQVEEIIALRDIVVISKTTCPFCASAKSALSEAAGDGNVSVIELDRLDAASGEAVQKHMGELTGATTVPRVFIGRKFIGGGTETVNLAQSGKLVELIKAAKEERNKELRGLHEAAVVKQDAEWKSELSPKAFQILRQRGTEPPGSHEYNSFLPNAGHFACAGCGLALYSASSKFASNCGWPVFDKCYTSEDIGCHVGTRSDGTGSLEIYCPRCNGHLGHVFFDAFSEQNQNGERH